MAIVPGSRVGGYEVTTQLGEGAMGVVFRARDTKLLRDVALKVLPDRLANDPDRLSRLQREAQVLASLNHPNIAHVYGLEQVGDSECIVMELVEGETLEDRLNHGRLPLHDALEIARQLADGLAAAHERGIVHRDLKPANIKLTSKGTVKILDFGLAKPFAGPANGSDITMLPTIATRSIAGSIFGTVSYMSPEQARGKEVDARTDIWAFGCVLYEMLTGRLAFGGETATDTIAAVLTGHPDMDALPPEVPASIRLLLSATLQKNVQQRLQHIGDARLFLDQAFASAVPSSPTVATVRTRGGAGMLAAAFAAGAAVALATFALYLRPRPQPPAPLMRFELVLPNYVSAPYVSPDGQHIAYAGAAQGENLAVWVRSIGSESTEKLAGTDKPTAAAWSPDGRALAVVSDGKLKKIELGTRSVQVICDVTEQVRGMTWGSSGVIVLSRKNSLYRVPADGGTLTQVMPLDTSRTEVIHGFPAFLPDGNHFLFAVGASEREKGGIFVGSLDGKTKIYLTPLGNRLTSVSYAPGYLLVGGDDLIAQPFDPKTLRLSGSPVPIVDGLGGFFAASNNGVLVFQKASTASPNKQLTWFDRSGKAVGQLGAPANYGNVEISPNGDRVAVDSTIDGNRDVWVIDVARSVPSRLTFDPAPDWTPVWSPDGSQIAFASSRGGESHIYVRPASGVGNDRLVLKSDSNEIPVSWSRDGRYIVFSRIKTGGVGVDTFLLTLAGEPEASPYIESPFDKAQARVSPDSRWITYVTNDSGTYQVVVQSFPDPNGGRWQITAQGGIEPKWRRDGRELYYLAPDGKLMAVPVNPGPAFQAGSPSELFQTPLVVTRSQSPRDRRYDVAADGRFLIAVPVAAATQAPATVVVNWTSLANR